jgi:2-methylisocitrate lyase-like PEP mutase family enzyme
LPGSKSKTTSCRGGSTWPTPAWYPRKSRWASWKRRSRHAPTPLPSSSPLCSAALGLCPLDEALERVRAYSQTGAEALMLTGAQSREQLEAVHQATSLPLCVLSPPADARNDQAFLNSNMRILMLGNPTFAVAVKAIHDSLKHLKDGGALEDLAGQQAAPDLLRQVNRADEFLALQERHVRE